MVPDPGPFVRDLATEAGPPDAAAAAKKIEDAESSGKVSRWVDAAAALVPAEVLALHAFIISIGTKTTGAGEDAVTTFTHASGVSAAFWAMLLLCIAFYFAGSKSFVKDDLIRMVIPPLAFVGWTMIQPNTAFDALGLKLDDDFARPAIAVFLIVALGILSGLMAKAADDA
jgi:hypothetical protein